MLLAFFQNFDFSEGQMVLKDIPKVPVCHARAVYRSGAGALVQSAHAGSVPLPCCSCCWQCARWGGGGGALHLLALMGREFKHEFKLLSRHVQTCMAALRLAAMAATTVILRRQGARGHGGSIGYRAALGAAGGHM